MLYLAPLSGFYFKSRLFPVEAIEDTYNQGQSQSRSKTTGCEEKGDYPGNNVTKERELIRRDPRLAETRHQKRFNRSMEPCWNIECSFLDCIEQNALCQFLVRKRGRWKPIRSEFTAYRDVVQRLRSDIQGGQRTVCQAIIQNFLERAASRGSPFVVQKSRAA